MTSGIMSAVVDRVTCDNCGVEVRRNRAAVARGARFCGTACRAAKRALDRAMVRRVCIRCGQAFESRGDVARTMCGAACARAAARHWMGPLGC